MTKMTRIRLSPVTITCCKDCVPPKRHRACHDTCPEYLEQKGYVGSIKDKKRKDKEDERSVWEAKMQKQRRHKKQGQR